MTKVGFIGLGLMGRPMAKHLIDDYDLHIYNRTKSKTDELLVLGAKYHETPKLVADNVDIVVIMVTDDNACRDVFMDEDGIYASSNTLTIINMSTITPEASRSFAEEASRHGMAFVEAPVSGTVGPAEDGTLTILTSGNSTEIEEIRPVLRHFGSKIYQFPKIGNALEVKLLINLNLAVQTAVLSETLHVAKSKGLNLGAVLDIINNSAVATVISKNKGENMINNEFPIAFPYKHMIKDLNYGTALGKLPLSEHTRELFDLDTHDLDFSAIYKTIQENINPNE